MKVMPKKLYSLGMCLSLGVAMSAASVNAQYMLPANTSETLPLERFKPAIDDTGFAVTEGGDISEKGDYQLGWIFNYSDEPLILNEISTDASGDTTTRNGWLVKNRLTSNLIGTFGLASWLSLGFDVPVTFFQTSRTFDFTSTGVTPSDAINYNNEVSGGGLGDIRLVPKFRLAGREEGGFGLALITNLTLPTSMGWNSPGLSGANTEGFQYGENYLGSAGGTGNKWYERIGFHPVLALSTNWKALRFAGNVGWRFSHPQNFRPYVITDSSVQQDILVGSEITYNLGLGINLAHNKDNRRNLLLFAELAGNTADRAPFGLGVDATTDPDWNNSARFMSGMEWLAGVRADLGKGVNLEVGGGTGLINGYGTPDWRIFGGLRYTKQAKVIGDLDQDGILDDVDQCPEVAEDKDDWEDENGCPDPDNDGDTVLDADDKCINEPGVPSHQGCPTKDADGDGILDADDKCPEVPGAKEREGCPITDKDEDGIPDDQDKCPEQKGPESREGCPIPDKDGDGLEDADDACPDEAGPKMFKGCPDKDGDGFPDNVDKCPAEAEIINGNEDDDGCPDEGKTLVKLVADHIEIKESVYFETSKSVIKERSYNLLNQVAAILRAHPEIKKCRVEGHTDSRGSDAMNLKLSQARAGAVEQYLIDHGISPTRLVSEGFGETKPIASNNTKAGRQQNRRVDFYVVEQEGVAPKPAE